MKYTTKWCPHCGKTITFMDPTKHQYGSPFRTCPKCRKGFVDKSFIELACTFEHAEDIPRVTGLSIASIILGAIFLAVAFIRGINDSYGSVFLIGGLLFLPLSIYSAYKDAKTYQHRVELFKTEMKESEARMSDPEYIRALLEIGYEVPTVYITATKEKLKAQHKFDSMLQSHLLKCSEVLSTSSLDYTASNMFDIYAIVYVISDFAVFNAGKNRDAATARMLPHIFRELSYLSSTDPKPQFRERIGFYSEVIRGIPLHAHCLPGVDISDANPVLGCAIAFCDCFLHPAYISNYNAAAPQLSALDVFVVATDLLEPLNEALTSLYNDIYDYAE